MSDVDGQRSEGSTSPKGPNWDTVWGDGQKMAGGQNGEVRKVKVGDETWVLKLPKSKPGLCSNEDYGYDIVKTWVHDNIVKTRGKGHLSDGSVIFAYLHCGDMTLANHNLSQDKISTVKQHVESAVKFIHSQGFTHGDLMTESGKGNVLIDADGKGTLIDFGTLKKANDYGLSCEKDLSHLFI